MLPLEVVEVSGMNDLLDNTQVEGYADRVGSSFRHDPIVLLRIPHHAPIGRTRPRAMIMIPLSQSVADRASALTFALACARARPWARKRRNTSRQGLTLRASLVEMPAFRTHA